MEIQVVEGLFKEVDTRQPFYRLVREQIFAEAQGQVFTICHLINPFNYCLEAKVSYLTVIKLEFFKEWSPKNEISKLGETALY